MKLFSRALSDRRVVLAWWTFGVLLYCGLIIAVWPVIEGNEDFEKVYEDMPDALAAIFGSDGFSDFTSPIGFLNTYLFSMILPFIFTALAISLGSSLLAGEEEDELLDLVLSYPVRRRRLVLEKAAAMAAALLGLGVLTVLFLALATEPVDLDVGLDGLAVATVGSLLFALMHGLVALLGGAWRGSKGFANGVGWAVVLAGYLANIIANVDASLDWIEPISPMYWATAGSPVSGEVPGTYVALIAVAAVLTGATVAVFDRHDLS